MTYPVKERDALLDHSRMAPALREPIIQSCTLVTGARLMLWGGVIRAILWTDLPEMEDQISEARLVARVAMPLQLGRDMAAQLRHILPTPSH